MTKEFYVTLDSTIGIESILYCKPAVFRHSIIEILRGLGYIVNDDVTHSSEINSCVIKDINDYLWNKMRYCTTVIGIPIDKILTVVNVDMIQLADIKLKISLRWEHV